MTKVYLLQILTLLSREYPYVTENPHLYRQNFIRIEAAIQYIDQHLADDLTLEAIASQAGMSRAYFSTVFKRLYGISPWDYILSRRIERAITLMEEQKDRTILELASLCGFNNTANFNRTFRRITGKTPTEYRKDGGHDVI
jgi:AraC-like DNA-binding protein